MRHPPRSYRADGTRSLASCSANQSASQLEARAALRHIRGQWRSICAKAYGTTTNGGIGGNSLDLIEDQTGAKERARFEWLDEHGLNLKTRRLHPDQTGRAAHRSASRSQPSLTTMRPASFCLRLSASRIPKNFLQRQPNGEWHVKGVRQVPYRLPELVEALAQEQIIVIVEGERKVDLLRSWNITRDMQRGWALVSGSPSYRSISGVPTSLSFPTMIRRLQTKNRRAAFS